MAKRVVTGTLLVLLGLALVYFGGAVLAVVGTLFISCALFEEYHALTVAGHRPIAWPTWIALVASVPLALLARNYPTVSLLMSVLLSACLLTLICVLFRSEPKLEDALMSLLPMLSVMLPGLCIISIALVQPLSIQRMMIALLLFVPALGDTLAFFIGSKIRGPKFCPAVSPNKTWAGSIAGLVGSLLSALVIRMVAGLLCGPATQPALFSWPMTIGIGVIGGVAAQIGDLFASLVKRHCQLKDFSNLFPGHGGMLDRIDSILFMSVVLMCFRLLMR